MVTGCAGGTISKVKGQLWATESGLETSEQGGKSVQTGRQRGQTSSTASSKLTFINMASYLELHVFNTANTHCIMITVFTVVCHYEKYVPTILEIEN